MELKSLSLEKIEALVSAKAITRSEADIEIASRKADNNGLFTKDDLLKPCSYDRLQRVADVEIVEGKLTAKKRCDSAKGNVGGIFTHEKAGVFYEALAFLYADYKASGIDETKYPLLVGGNINEHLQFASAKGSSNWKIRIVTA